MYISLNEYKDAERYIDERDIGQDFYNKLRVMAGFHKYNGLQDSDIKEELRNYVRLCGESPTLNVWSDMIDSAVKSANKTGLVMIDKIVITQSEVDKIKQLEGVQLQRLAFALLCISKYRDETVNKNNHWVCMQDKEIMRLANLRLPLKRQAYLYRTLKDLGYLKFPRKKNSISMRVNYIDNESEEEICVTNFKDLGYQYLKYLGQPYFECESCGSITKIKKSQSAAGRKPKYCENCAALISAKQRTESVMRLRGTT